MRRTHYARAIQDQARELLEDHDHEVFALVNPNKVGAAVRRDPPMISAVGRHQLERTLDLAAWLGIYHQQVALQSLSPTECGRRAA